MSRYGEDTNYPDTLERFLAAANTGAIDTMIPEPFISLIFMRGRYAAPKIRPPTFSSNFYMRDTTRRCQALSIAHLFSTYTILLIPAFTSMR